MKKKNEYVRINTRILKTHDDFIKAEAKKMKVYEADIHRVIIQDFIDRNKKPQ